MPDLIVIAGPNGAGKTTFASEFLPAEPKRFAFINADEIAREIARAGLSQQQLDMRAGRAMLERINALVDAGADLAVETTLASLSYAQKIPGWQRRGYMVSLVYVRLSSVEDSIARVRKRVEAGGHGIPEETLRRRYGKSVDYFETVYKPLVDRWYIYESVEGRFVRVASWQDD